MIKEEYLGYNTFDIVLKKEDGGFVKIEPDYVNPFIRPQISLFSQTMALPWTTQMMQFQLLSSSLKLGMASSLFSAPQYDYKPFKIIREPLSSKSPLSIDDHLQTKIEEETPEDKPIQISIRRKRTHVSACKNYIALLCLGISRAILTSDPESQMACYIRALLDQKKKKFETFESQNDEKLMEFLRKHVYKTMCGKKIKKSRRKKDFKIRNSEELSNLLTIRPTDNESVRLMKEVLKEVIGYFFNSEYYCQWLSTCMMSETNRSFFMANKTEIQKKFLNPTTYKPHFSHFPVDN